MKDKSIQNRNVGTEMTKVDSWSQCAAYCEADPACHAWQYVTKSYKLNDAHHMKCRKKDATWKEGKIDLEGVIIGKEKTDKCQGE